MIAGGLLLLCISLRDLLVGAVREREVEDPRSLGAVPLGVPLITGPAVLTTCILLAQTHGKPLTALAAAINVALAGVIFRGADLLATRLGRTGIRTISKIASMLLAAIAVMLIRRGVQQTLAAG